MAIQIVPARDPDLANAEVFYVGARYVADVVGTELGGLKFDGFDVRDIVLDGVVPVEHVVIDPRYWDGEDWVSVPSFVDETQDFVDGYRLPFMRNGAVHWHVSQFGDDWETTEVDGVTGYWIEVRFRTLDGDQTTIPATSAAVDAPGIRAFVRPPVNGIFPVRIEGQSVLVSGADRLNLQTDPDLLEDGEHASLGGGVETGAQLGVKKSNMESTLPVLLLEDEGAGVWDEAEWARYLVDDVESGPDPAPSFGTADRLQKIRTQFYDGQARRYIPYEWPIDTWRGGLLTPNDLTEDGVQTTAARIRVAADDRWKKTNGYYRGCRMRFADSLGVPQYEREIWDYRVEAAFVNFYVYPDFGADPGGTDLFSAFAPHARCAVDEFGDRISLEIIANTAHLLTFTEGVAYEADPNLSRIQHWHIGRELRWVLDSGLRWSGVIDTVTGRLFVTNGGPLLEFDGEHLRRLRADTTSPLAAQLAGEVRDIPGVDQRLLARSSFRPTPPLGRYIAVHRGSIFVAGIPGQPYTLMWSAPGAANNIWPYWNEALVRDQEQDPITGMWTLGDRLIVGTPTALHEVIDTGSVVAFDVAPVAQGIGFVSQQAACVFSHDGVSQLVGVAPEGLVAYSNGEPTVVLDSWERLIEGGVNVDALHLAVAVSAPHMSCCFFAVPARGNSRNNRIIRWDFFRKTLYVLSAPFGVSAMSVDLDENGQERVLFGTDDGYVMTFGNALTDDGTTIEAFATSPPVEHPSGSEVQVAGLLLSARTLGPGASQRMTTRLMRGDDVTVPLVDGLVTVDKGDTAWGSADWDEFTWQAHGYKTVEMKCPVETKAHRIAYQVGGSVMWSLKTAELLLRELARKGRG